MKDEIRKIPFSFGYYVSKAGKVYRRDGTTFKEVKGWIVKQYGVPYRRVRIKVSKGYNSKDRQRNDKDYYVHRLVMLTFGDKPTKEQTEVNHKDGNSLNNRFDNLHWCTHNENMKHKNKEKEDLPF